MRQKLKIERKTSSLEEFQAARRSLIFWPRRDKLDVLEGLIRFEDAGISRTKYAAANRISRRTLQRWVRDFNSGGLMNALDQTRRRPGQKPKVGLLEFRNRVLPAAQYELRQTGRPETIKNLCQAAQNLGLVDLSYATFRRRLRQTNSYHKRPKIQPTFDEWMYQINTGRWPRRLRAFGRRQARRQQRARQRARESLRRDAQAEHQ